MPDPVSGQLNSLNRTCIQGLTHHQSLSHPYHMSLAKVHQSGQSSRWWPRFSRLNPLPKKPFSRQPAARTQARDVVWRRKTLWRGAHSKHTAEHQKLSLQQIRGFLIEQKDYLQRCKTWHCDCRSYCKRLLPRTEFCCVGFAMRDGLQNFSFCALLISTCPYPRFTALHDTCLPPCVWTVLSERRRNLMTNWLVLRCIRLWTRYPS